MTKPDPALTPSLEGRVALVTGSTRGLGRAMANGFATAGARGIRVNCIAPGTFETDMIDWMDDEIRARAKEMAPLGRFADPKEIVPAALFLASEQSTYMRGSVLTIDGGLMP